MENIDTLTNFRGHSHTRHLRPKIHILHDKTNTRYRSNDVFSTAPDIQLYTLLIVTPCGHSVLRCKITTFIDIKLLLIFIKYKNKCSCFAKELPIHRVCNKPRLPSYLFAVVETYLEEQRYKKAPRKTHLSGWMARKVGASKGKRTVM
jgi:hypothetical protein